MEKSREEPKQDRSQHRSKTFQVDRAGLISDLFQLRRNSSIKDRREIMRESIITLMEFEFVGTHHRDRRLQSVKV